VSSGLFESSYLESISLEDSNDEVIKRQYQKVNHNLALLQQEIFDSIKYENIDKFIDCGGLDQQDLNF
jgi:hypothetical protein